MNSDSRSRLFRAFFGLAIAFGPALFLFALLAHDAKGPSGQSSRLSGLTNWLMFFVPPLFLYGIVTSIRNLRSGAAVVSKRSLLYASLLMLLVGACPWAYTRYLTGGSPGNEGAGMLGTLIFIFVGIPGFILTVIGLVAGWINED